MSEEKADQGKLPGFGTSNPAWTDHILSILSKSPRTPTDDKRIGAEITHAKGKQDLRFRPRLFWCVVGLMMFEVAALFVVVFFQGFGAICGHPFHLDQWVLTSINVGILAQTFGLAKIITKALFKEL